MTLYEFTQDEGFIACVQDEGSGDCDQSLEDWEEVYKLFLDFKSRG